MDLELALSIPGMNEFFVFDDAQTEIEKATDASTRAAQLGELCEFGYDIAYKVLHMPDDEACKAYLAQHLGPSASIQILLRVYQNVKRLTTRADYPRGEMIMRFMFDALNLVDRVISSKYDAFLEHEDLKAHVNRTGNDGPAAVALERWRRSLRGPCMQPPSSTADTMVTCA